MTENDSPLASFAEKGKIELGTGKVVKIEQKLSPKEHIRRIKEIIRGAKVSGRGK
jgi:hypothetical protein